MISLGELGRRLAMLVRRRKFDREMDEEMRLHLELREKEHAANGFSSDEAHTTVRKHFGNALALREASHDSWGWGWFEHFVQDLRFALRMLRKNPGFTAIAVVMLALGIGANTAIFSVVDAVLLRPLPYPHSEELVVVSEALPGGLSGCSYPDFTALRKQNNVFTEMAGNAFHALTLTGAGVPLDVSTIPVTPEVFSMLDEKPLLGRAFFPEDNKQGAPPVVILSDSLWRGAFGADSKIIGKTISLDKRGFTVAGVMPTGFRYPPLADARGIWIPMVQDPFFSGFMPLEGSHYLRVVGRLKDGVSLAQAQAEMYALGLQVAKKAPPGDSNWTIRLEPLQQKIVGNVKSALLVLLGAVGLVLLIACANIANLLLSRATSRTKEMAVRAALGAGRRRLIRQLLTESAVLGLLGAFTGVALAYWGVQALSSLLPPDLPVVTTIGLDGRVLVFALAISVVASLLFGLAPALMAAGCNFQTALKDATQGSGEGGRGRRARNLLAVAEIAVALALVVAAGLFVRSFAALTSVSPGFDPQHVVQAEVSLPQFQYKTPQQWNAFTDQLLARVQASPGLQDSAVGVPPPLMDGGFINLGFAIAGNPPLPGGAKTAVYTADYVMVSPNYFHVMGIPLLRGRLFSAMDSAMAPTVTLISEAMVRMYFGNRDPIGKHLIFGFPPNGDASREIVGVVGDVRDVSLGQKPEPMMYVPYAQAPVWGAVVLVKTSLGAGASIKEIRQAVDSIDRDLPVTNTGLLADNVNTSEAQPRFRMMLLGLFGTLALALAAAGIFGVISYSVSCRTREVGVRMALGASPRAIQKMVLREGLRIAGAGLAAGILAALALTRLLKGQLYGIGATDPYTFVGAAILLVLVALAACYVPARRAMKVDPMVALRYE
ncbi:MAG: ABC transporter permease [Candidatus Acidiferrales bacterium]